MIKKILTALLISSLICIVSCEKNQDKNTIKVGTISGPETQLMEIAKQVALQKFGLNIKIIEFSDFNAPNAALHDGQLDANAFQHIPFLNEQNTQHHYHIVAIGKTFIYPMGLYSYKIKSLNDLPNKAKVAVPNDPSNEGRALLLLEKTGLIKLKENVGYNAMPTDIAENPKQLQLVELDAAELPRVLNDVTLAAINTNYAIPAGLSPNKDAIYLEDTQSPYANIIAVRAKDKNKKELLELVQSFQSPAVIEIAKKIFGEGAVAAWVEPKQKKSDQ